MAVQPAFGQADLSNCERELIHLAGSVQPHGLLLVLHGPDLRVVQASQNTPTHLGIAPEALLQQPLRQLSPRLAQQVADLAAEPLREPAPFQCALGVGGRRPHV